MGERTKPHMKNNRWSQLERKRKKRQFCHCRKRDKWGKFAFCSATPNYRVGRFIFRPSASVCICCKLKRTSGDEGRKKEGKTPREGEWINYPSCRFLFILRVSRSKEKLRYWLILTSVRRTVKASESLSFFEVRLTLRSYPLLVVT